MRLQRSNKGFTIVELMIATAVFSMVLLLCAMAIVQVGRMFYKGVTINRTQDTARKVADDIVQSIQFGVGSSTVPVTGSWTYGSAPGNTDVQSLCLGDVRYSYVTNRSLGSNTNYQARHVLWKDRITAGPTCPTVDLTQATPSAGGEEMLGDNMRVPLLSVPNPSANNIWSVSVTVAYGDTADLFTDGTFTKCIGSNAGGQFCAVSAISTNVVKRL